MRGTFIDSDRFWSRGFPYSRRFPARRERTRRASQTICNCSWLGRRPSVKIRSEPASILLENIQAARRVAHCFVQGHHSPNDCLVVRLYLEHAPGDCEGLSKILSALKLIESSRSG